MKKILFSVNRNKIKITDKDINSLKNEKKCYFCGTNVEKYGHVHATETKVVKSCSLCYHMEHLDSLTSLDKGCVILMPELSQIELFGVLRMIWYLNILEENSENEQYEEVYNSASTMYNLIEERKEYAENYYANSISNVEVITNFLHSIDDSQYKNREQGLKHLLWLPSYKAFKDEMDYWIQVEHKKFSPKNFKPLLKKVIDIKQGKS